MTLSQEEYEECRIAFNKFDQDGSGKIDVPELRATLQALGQHPTDEELFLMISSVDDDNSGEIEFPEFVKIIQQQKVSEQENEEEQDTLLAFVALGGNDDKSGEVSTDKLRSICKEFSLTLDIDKFIEEVDQDGSGTVDFEEFSKMMLAAR